MKMELFSSSLVHFHIRWSSGSALDWEAFETHAEAEATAGQLAHPYESYKIVKRTRACKRCADFWREKVASLNRVGERNLALSQAHGR